MTGASETDKTGSVDAREAGAVAAGTAGASAGKSADKGAGKAILCVGSIMVDVVCPIDALPKSGEGVVSEGARMALGGCSFNSANAVRQSGGDVFLFAPVGNGPFASYVRNELGRLGLEALDLDAGIDTGAAICLVEPDGERTMLTIPGIERRFETEWFEGFDTSQFGCVEVCGYEIDGVGGEAIIGYLEAHPELLLYFAPGPMIARIATDRMERLFALRPVLHLNALEARTYTGIDDLDDAGFALSELAGNAVVVTDGARGAHVFIDEGPDGIRMKYSAPTDPVKPLDTIGAGDAHIGALMAKRAQGADWEEALAFANRVSRGVCQVAGATLSDEDFERLVG